MEHPFDKKSPEPLEFKPGGPFHDMVSVFLVASLGASDVTDINNRERFRENVRAVYQGRIQRAFSVDHRQIHETAQLIPPDELRSVLCCLLANSAYESVKGQLVQVPRSPVFEVFRHVRNAASHHNRFYFRGPEPRLPAEWRGWSISPSLKGSRNPLHGQRCFPDILGPADLVVLLADVEILLAARPPRPAN